MEIDIKQKYVIFNNDLHFPEVTVHGRFQPPLHKNHYNYIADAFKIADKVHILITNPYLNDKDRKEALHRSLVENNPFTYEERVEIFKIFFNKINISKSRYDFSPFEITKESAWNNLNKKIPNLINTYSDWSYSKMDKFKKLGFVVIHSNIPRAEDVSGNGIRKILREKINLDEAKEKLIQAGYMKEAIEGLFEIIKKKN